MGLLKFIRDRDNFGFLFNLNYKGDEMYQTYLGAVSTISIKVIVLLQLINLAIALYDMSEPAIRTYQRPMLKSEISDYGDVSLNDNFFTIGLIVSD